MKRPLINDYHSKMVKHGDGFLLALIVGKICYFDIVIHILKLYFPTIFHFKINQTSPRHCYGTSFGTILYRTSVLMKNFNGLRDKAT